MKTFCLSYIPLGGTEADRTQAIVTAPTFAEAALKLPAYEGVRVSRPLNRKRLKAKKAYLARIADLDDECPSAGNYWDK